MKLYKTRCIYTQGSPNCPPDVLGQPKISGWTRLMHSISSCTRVVMWSLFSISTLDSYATAKVYRKKLIYSLGTVSINNEILFVICTRNHGLLETLSKIPAGSIFCYGCRWSHQKI